jgi:hypothetical protein
MGPVLQKEDQNNIDFRLLANKYMQNTLQIFYAIEKIGNDFISLMTRKTAISHGDLICVPE